MVEENMVEWRFGIVGNIKAQHLGESGEILYGTNERCCNKLQMMCFAMMWAYAQ